MTVYSEFAEVTARLASLPRVLLARQDDAARLERHGTLNGEREAKLAGVVKRLRKAADEIEKAIL